MNINVGQFSRPAALFAAVALLAGTALPALSVLNGETAYAAQVQNRKVQMSDASPSGGSITTGVGSGTNVSYDISFTNTTASNIGGIVIDICDNTPLIGDTSCTYPAGFSWGASPSVTVDSGTLAGTWTAAGVQAGAGAGNTQVLELSNTTPETPIGNTVHFTVTGVTNPNTSTLDTTTGSHTFYARILTFDTAGNMTSQYTTTSTTRAASFANMVDYGGAALSIERAITVTARVMETLSLCTAKATYTGVNCAGPTSTDVPSVILGHGPNLILDTSAIDTANVYTQVSTNAANGYALYLRASNACAGLSKDGGTTCGIPAVNAGGSTGATITAGTAAFGATVSDGTTVAGGSGTNTAVARWKTTAPAYIMDNTTANDNVTYTYGSKIAEATGQANGVLNTITFAATASPTTAAGIYSQNFSLIGVGVF